MITESPLKKSKAPGGPVLAKDRFGFKEAARPTTQRTPVATQPTPRPSQRKAPSSLCSTASTSSGKRSASDSLSPSLLRTKKPAASPTSRPATSARTSPLCPTPAPASKRNRLHSPSSPLSPDGSPVSKSSSCASGSPLSSLSSASARDTTPLLKIRPSPPSGVYRDRAAMLSSLHAANAHATTRSNPSTQGNKRHLAGKRNPLTPVNQRDAVRTPPAMCKKPKSIITTPTPPSVQKIEQVINKVEEKVEARGEAETPAVDGFHEVIRAHRSIRAGMERQHADDMARVAQQLDKERKERLDAIEAHACTTAMLHEEKRANEALLRQLDRAATHQTEVVNARHDEMMDKENARARLLTTALGFETEDDVCQETRGLGNASLLQVLHDERARNAELVRQLTQEKAEKDKISAKLCDVEAQLEAIKADKDKEIRHMRLKYEWLQGDLEDLQGDNKELHTLVSKLEKASIVLKHDVAIKQDLLRATLHIHDTASEKARIMVEKLERECTDLRNLVTGVCGATHAMLHTHRTQVAQALDVLAQPEGQRPMDVLELVWPLVQLADVFVGQVYSDVEAALVRACTDPLLQAREGQGATLGTDATAGTADKLECIADELGVEVEEDFQDCELTEAQVVPAQADLSLEHMMLHA